MSRRVAARHPLRARPPRRRRAPLLAAAIATLLATGLSHRAPADEARSTRGPAGAAPAPARGYDHLVHEGQVSVSGGARIPCTACHTVGAHGRLRGRPDHASCFGRCHGSPPRRGRHRRVLGPDRRRICVVCHAPAVIDRVAAGNTARAAVFYPPYTLSPDYGIKLSHAAHARAGGAAADCLTCHRDPARRRRRRHRRPHALCAGCHRRGPAARAVSMHDCKGCHVAAYGPINRPHMDLADYPATKSFSHRAHASRVPPGSAGCRVCHAALDHASGWLLPAPTKAVCRSCHDGKRAFSVVGPSCNRCHTRPDTTSTGPRPGLAPALFSHRAHQRRGLSLTCRRCHTLAPDGSPRPASADHAPCADAGCHQADFSSKHPHICGVCHVTDEPWRPLHLDRPLPPTEFGARFSHRAHYRHDRALVCTRCHVPTPGGDLTMRPGHQECAGASCHGDGSKRGNPGRARPRLDDCTGCHQLGLLQAHERSSARRRWSVRRRFRHRPHLTEPGHPSTPVPCTACHTGIRQTDRLADIRPPKKRTCAPCHNGVAAFKLTGHECARCHGP